MMRVQPTQTTVRALSGIRCGDHAISRPLTTKVISDCRTILTHSIINGEIQGDIGKPHLVQATDIGPFDKIGIPGEAVFAIGGLRPAALDPAE
jgi:hypothetical protein